MTDERVGAAALSKLKWRCRRGLLENDIFIARFFARYAPQLTQGDAIALLALMDLGDRDLLDLHLGRQQLAQIAPELDDPATQKVLSLLKRAASNLQ